MLNKAFHLPTAPTGLKDRPCSSVVVMPQSDSSSRTRFLFYCDRTRENMGPVLLAAKADALGPFDSLRRFRAASPDSVALQRIKINDGLTLENAKSVLKQAGFQGNNDQINTASKALQTAYSDIFVGSDSLQTELFLSIVDGKVVVCGLS